ncbi:integrin alpha-M-like protein [Labeo rohita]|uniref:Integrin alpha-M-like protein n=1 Tax=Labeo rohita TaxID=84645 RepID=A0A498P3N7_LABRO|nr:integrin alpha-M-like protein [Labeo rohita]
MRPGKAVGLDGVCPRVLKVCGPTIPKNCDVTTYNGMCFKISSENVVSKSVPRTLRECPSSQIDIAFLLDGSGSVHNADFNKMKAFVVEMIKSFIDHDTQFAIAQFSTDCEIHDMFQVQSAKMWEDAVTKISQRRGGTHTAKAIKQLVRELFVSEGGARPSASKILVVITDGESTDKYFLAEAVQQAQAKNITRYAIGVGNAFNNYQARRELAIIASLPTNKHVFKVTDFDALDSIREQLKENIIAIEGTQTTGDSSRMEFAQDGFSAALASNPQIGSYFGAELCVVDLNSDSRTDLLLVSAPTYIEPDQEGKVFVYTFNRRSYFIFSDTVLVGMAGQRGRFGSSLASPADLNGDGYMDVLIGAPLEEDGQGSIYIFNGGPYEINPTYSQRIAGLSVQPGLRFFGISLSQSSLDQSADSLPDIAVGSMGAVLLLRSRPIMYLETKVTYNPSKIPTSGTDQSLKNTMTVCFTMRPYNHNIRGLTANINYTITLDAKHQKYRAYFTPKNRFHNSMMNMNMKETCNSHPFSIDGFSEDALNPLSNQLTFTFEGLPSGTLQNISPILLPGIKTTTDHNLDFEINCGRDDICVDDLRMDFNFSGSTNIEVGIMQEINVTVFVENRGENSYNTRFILSYPFGLSYRRIISKQGRVECVSLDSEQKGSFGEFTCHISKPILKGNSQVENDFRELSFKVFIRVPVMLGDKSIWTNKNIEIPDCVKQRDLQPVITDFVEVIKKDRVVNCSVAVCAEFSCDNTLIKNERKFYNITGNTGLRAAVFQLVSSASLDYDKSKYVFFSSDSQQTAPSVQINTQVEVYEEVNLTKEIAGGVIGGLLLLALITAALYKVCGPTIPKNCDVTTYNGMCFKISLDNVVSRSVPKTLRECPTSQIDIAFLMDGSGSVNYVDFNKMKNFVIEMIKSFIDLDTQFAIAQFSTNCFIHHKFQQVKNAKSWEDAVTKIDQKKGWTNTAKAIKQLVRELFVSEGGTRPSASKILVVITDGESTDKDDSLTEAVQQAQAKKITRYAIGVGNAFIVDKAINELATIASLPTDKHVFKVTNFDALASIREQLKENIIAIEGTQTTGDSSRMEFAQDGFSAALTSNPQIGSYFGAELCVVDLNSDSRTDLLLVSAPTYIEPDQEGKVFVYTFNSRSYFTFSGTVLVGMAGQRGRFGSSLASPADLNGDGYMDVLIGAPLEEDGQGSIYIFNGGAYQINLTYSQRIAGLSVQPGLRFFGISLSQSSLDQSADSLPDIAVGSMGAVLLLRSRPIMYLETKLDFEINCGRDDICIDDLRMDFNFSGSTNIEVGIMQEINMTVFVENRGENSYNTFFTLSYPFGLSYRRIISKQGRVECVSLDSEQKGLFGETTCHISKPILKGNSKVENDFRELSFKVFIRVPVVLGDKSIWTNKNIQIPGCVKQRDLRPAITNFVDVIKRDRMVNCSVAACAEFSCDDTLTKNERKFYNITGNVSSGWIEQTGLRAAVFQLVSSASLDYDKSKYVFFSSDSQQTAPSVQAGFFKSQYKQLLENAEQSPEEGPITQQTNKEK